MTDSRAAVAADRLPWLSDEPAPRPKPGLRHLFGWLAAAAILLVAAVAYWLGERSAEQGAAPQSPAVLNAPTTTVPLPQPRIIEPAQPQVSTKAPPEVEPRAAPAIPLAEPDRRPRLEPVLTSEQGTAAQQSERTQPDAASPAEDGSEASRAPPAKAPAPRADPLRPWPVRVVPGASGRLVRVGAFTSPRQAKKGWWAIMRMNPALKRLPALVVPAPSMRDGRTYYRLQMGTTSQAHSEVLCQRMRSIGQSCVVIEVYNRGEGAAE
jgi:hypothetical protein